MLTRLGENAYMLNKINQIDAMLLKAFKQTFIYVIAFVILGCIAAFVINNVSILFLVVGVSLFIIMDTIYRICSCIDGRVNKYIGECVFVYKPTIKEKANIFSRPYIILKNKEGQNIKFYNNRSLNVAKGNTVTLFVPIDTILQESENTFVINSFYYSYVSDY